MNKWWLAGLSLPAVAGLIWIAMGRVGGAHPSARESTEIVQSAPVRMSQSDNVAQKAEANTPKVASVATTVDSTSKAQPMQMKALQELLDKDPAAALVVARKDLARDPEGPDAAEQSWVVVKSLAVLGRFEEARREAAVMVPKFRGTRWANDVERHVLAHP